MAIEEDAVRVPDFLSEDPNDVLVCNEYLQSVRHQTWALGYSSEGHEVLAFME